MVIANAGVSYVWPKVSEVRTADLQGHLTPNVFGVVWLYQAMRALLERSAKPVWVTMGSSAGLTETQPPIPNAGYGPSKAAVHWLTKRIDAEEDRIAAIVLDPGWVQTEMGNSGAVALGLECAPVTVEDSCQGMVKVLDGVEKASHGGRFWDYTGALKSF
ncbi:NAD(P)-binding protein [Lentithecium fluviatile CBS 122367]|uniref:NAD(P)-binding protein n=1 Tax=Lentithecium fluviatile CBS 122367 TaxID=1168545 RepID=A0A6G1J1M2_9PLEO|nr:NAD(P)-binding protein [Lentithecium fluviatile CBS 122367]